MQFVPCIVSLDLISPSSCCRVYAVEGRWLASTLDMLGVLWTNACTQYVAMTIHDLHDYHTA